MHFFPSTQKHLCVGMHFAQTTIIYSLLPDCGPLSIKFIYKTKKENQTWVCHCGFWVIWIMSSYETKNVLVWWPWKWVTVCIKSTENTVQYCFIHAAEYILYLSSPVYPFPPCCFNFIASQSVMKTKHDTFPTKQLNAACLPGWRSNLIGSPGVHTPHLLHKWVTRLPRFA